MGEDAEGKKVRRRIGKATRYGRIPGATSNIAVDIAAHASERAGVTGVKVVVH